MGVPYRPVSLAARRAELAAADLLPFQPAMLMSIYSAIAAGFLAGTQGDLQDLLPHPPRDNKAAAVDAARR